MRLEGAAAIAGAAVRRRNVALWNQRLRHSRISRDAGALGHRTWSPLDLFETSIATKGQPRPCEIDMDCADRGELAPNPLVLDSSTS